MITTATYGGKTVIISDYSIDCTSEEVTVRPADLRAFYLDRKERVVGVGMKGDRPIFIKAVQDSEGFIHIGCVKETKESFEAKYLEIYKMLAPVKTEEGNGTIK